MTLLATYAVFFALWLWSLRLRDVSIVDIAWGPAFSIAPVASVLGGAPLTPRRLLVLGLVLAWGLRLGAHLFLRSRGHGEDYRYAAMRDAQGPAFAWRSLVTVFALQATLVCVISLPINAVFAAGAPSAISMLDVVAAVIVLVGLSVETLADLQLTRFRSAASQRGRVLDTGLWRYSRHPNYFGDAVVWWGFGLLGLSGLNGWAAAGAVLGPVTMTFLLLRVSGVRLLEQTITTRRPDYAAYVASTSAFIPWPPKRVASGVKRQPG